MITGIQNFYYYSTNMKRSIEFYTKGFGMEVMYQDEHWANLSCHGVTVALHSAEGEEIPHVPRDAHGAKAGGSLTLKSDNIAEDKSTLENLGAKIIGENDADWGHMLVFEDPDGNVLNLMHPKY
jgi:catechol 2,3-dioxygenase-like lactoylglutathione lyase family enzyme